MIGKECDIIYDEKVNIRVTEKIEGEKKKEL